MTPKTLKKANFLFGPRGTGKTSFIRSFYNIDSKNINYIDLLDEKNYLRLSVDSSRLSDYITHPKKPVIADEVQRIPELLNEVHRLIESEKIVFVLTGSSARKLRKAGVNLLAGRALQHEMFPLTAAEIKSDFNLKQALKRGMLPAHFSEKYPEKYIYSYIATYLKEEVQMERLTRNLSHFNRFLEAAAFCQGQSLNMTNVSKDCHVERKTVEDFFSILEDLLISFRLPIFSKRAKRELLLKDKFYFFDCGVFRAIRFRGPLDSEAEIDGICLETLVVQEIRAINKLYNLKYELFH